jgi:hypothetical protein
MRFLRELMLVVAAMVIIGLAGKAWGAECLHSAAAVRAEHPGAWSSWSQRVPGHAGEKCYFASERKVVHASLVRASKHTPSYTAAPAPSASVGVPFPREAPVLLTKEQELERLIPFNERWVALGLSWR